VSTTPPTPVVIPRSVDTTKALKIPDMKTEKSWLWWHIVIVSIGGGFVFMMLVGTVIEVMAN